MTHFVMILFIFTSLTCLCEGCLRTPTIDSTPSIITSTMIIGPSGPCDGSFTSGPGVEITSETINASGESVLTVRCTNGVFLISVNGNRISMPIMLTCDAARGKYIYTNSMFSLEVNTLTC